MSNALLSIGTRIDFSKLRFDATRSDLTGTIEKYVDNGEKVRVRHENDGKFPGVTEMPYWYIMPESIVE